MTPTVNLVKRVSIQTIIINAILSAFKLLAGLLAHSSAMVSDAVHSASDVLSTFVVIAGHAASRKEADTDHPYGHERLECISAIVLSIMLLGTGVGIGYGGVRRILSGVEGQWVMPGALALVAAAVSIAVKEWMYWYTRAVAKKADSGALMADAWHHRSDALSSVGSLAGILGARMGLPILDPIACLVICLLIIKTAIGIFLDAVNKMVDRSCDDATQQAMKRLILKQPGVLSLDLLQTRVFGNRVYVDIEISADSALNLGRAHDIAQTVHDQVEQRFARVKHCMVHVNPLATPSEQATVSSDRSPK